MTRTSLTFSLIASVVACCPGIAIADPILGRDVLKFAQEPMLATVLQAPGAAPQTYAGHDELSTAYSVRNDAGAIIGYAGDFMADDFADKFSSPVVHVQWWGSYRPSTIPNAAVQKFLISFESDIPAGTGGANFSRPGQPLLNQIVSLDTDGVFAPGEGTFTEKPTGFSSIMDGPTYVYNAELNLGKEFFQKENTVYWLKIVALVESNPNIPIEQRLQWGWHNRDYTLVDPLASTALAVVPGERVVGVLPSLDPNGTPIWHFQDDAVDGFVNVILDPNNPIMPIVQQDVRGPKRYLPLLDGPQQIADFSKDLAFRLYTVPEPASVGLVLIALVGTGLAGRRRS